MNEAMKFMLAPTLKAPSAAIQRMEPESLTDCSKCEGNIHVGLFFDGTNNNRDVDMPKLQHSNVARLFDAYLGKSTKGYFPRYIPGVGTAFPEVREKGESSFGSGFAIGCEQRVLFAILHVFNALHRSADKDAPLMTRDQIAALCCNCVIHPRDMPADFAAVSQLGLSSGLAMMRNSGGYRVRNLKALAQRLQVTVAKGLPRIKECFVDVIGFSRGAAEARVFCHWLDEILIGGTLAGVKVHFRFLGIMDTVASAGFLSSVGAAVTGGDGGHSGWAESRFLRIPASVKNCVHMVAAHELRKNFPLDTISTGGTLPSTCQEFMYPGSHSDVGGGYAPGELGIATDSDKRAADAQKLSQIPLNHMLECAIAAGVPLSRDRAVSPSTGYDPFTLSPLVQKAYDDFVAYSTPRPRAVHEWLQPYLSWRWQIRLSFANLNHVRKAGEKDRALLIKYNAMLIDDAEYLTNSFERPSFSQIFTKRAPGQRNRHNAIRSATLDDEARTVLAHAKAAQPTDPRLAHLFDRFVHDSLAGFDLNSIELTGYWRYRKGYLGEEKRLIVDNNPPPADDVAVA